MLLNIKLYTVFGGGEYVLPAAAERYYNCFRFFV